MKMARIGCRIAAIVALASALGAFDILLGQEVHLQWDANPEESVAGYNVYRGDGEGAELAQVNITGLLRELEFIDRGVQAGARYCYSVTAVDSSGLESEFSNVFCLNAPLANQPPVLVDDFFTLQEDGVISFEALANDDDPEGDSLSIVDFSQPRNGGVVLDGTRFVYTPNEDFYGQDSFVYSAADSQGNQSQASVDLQVQAVNDCPVARPDRFSLHPDSTAALAVLANDSDGDGEALQVIHVSQLGSAQVGVNPDGTVSFSRTGDDLSPTVFSYQVIDTSGCIASSQVYVAFALTSDGEPPQAKDDFAATDEDVAVSIRVLSNDFDSDGDALRITSLSRPSHGVAYIGGKGRITYIPQDDFHGTDRFEYVVGDEKGEQDTAQVTVKVRPVNDAPQADAGTDLQVLQGQQAWLRGKGRDADGDALTYLWKQVGGPPVQLLQADQPEAFFFAPDERKNATLTFQLTVSDSETVDQDRVEVRIEKRHPVFIPLSRDGDGAGLLQAALWNPHQDSNEVILTGLNFYGSETSLADSSFLYPGGGLSLAGDDPSLQLSDSAAIVAEGLQGDLDAALLFWGAASRDQAALGRLQESAQLSFLDVRSDATQSTALHLFNPDPRTPAEVTLRLFDRQGRLLDEFEATILGMGSLRAEMSDIFGGLEFDGYLQAASTLPIQGLQLRRRGGALSALPGLPATASTRLVVPHFSTEARTQSELRLLNSGKGDVTLDLTAYDEGGVPKGRAQLALASGGLLAAPVEEIFGFDAEGRSGYVVIHVFASDEAPSLSAALVFEGRGTGPSAAMPLSPREERFHQFPEMALGSGGQLALINPHRQTTMVRIEVYGPDGVQHSQASFLLPARKKILAPLDSEQYFGPSFQAQAGRIRIVSMLPVSAFAISSHGEGETLTALEGQVP